MGGGSSLVEARRLNMDCIGLDVDPMAWFVTHQELRRMDVGVLGKAFEEVRLKAQPKVDRFYKTMTDDGERAKGRRRNGRIGRILQFYLYFEY